jgi:hypothetical protein
MSSTSAIAHEGGIANKISSDKTVISKQQNFKHSVLETREYRVLQLKPYLYEKLRQGVKPCITTISYLPVLLFVELIALAVLSLFVLASLVVLFFSTDTRHE